jgi:hypothetical protein
MKITAQLAGCGSAERHWKGFKFKGMHTKKKIGWGMRRREC